VNAGADGEDAAAVVVVVVAVVVEGPFDVQNTFEIAEEKC